jgi:ABC-type dipeptide/oligopeptide/nickel transport system permease component
MRLLTYTVKRIGASLPILFCILFFTFLLFDIILPNLDPLDFYLENQPNSVEMAYSLSLNQKSTFTQFWIFLSQKNSLNSIIPFRSYSGMSVWKFMWQRISITFEMQTIVTILSAFIGIRLGMFSVVHRYKYKEKILRFLTFFVYSIPVFWLGLLFRYLFSYMLNWFPLQGYASGASLEFLDIHFITGFGMLDSLMARNLFVFLDILHHMFLPIVVLVIGNTTGLIHYVRTSMLDLLDLDYIRTARAKGCCEKDIIYKHAMKNLIIPTISLIGLNFGYMITTTTLIEITFDLHGLGRLFLNAVNNGDYEIIQAIIIFLTGLVILINILSDVIYGFLDPRIRY